MTAVYSGRSRRQADAASALSRCQGNAAMTPEHQVIKAAGKALVRAFGGQDAAAMHVHRSQGRVSDWCSPNKPDFMPVDAVMTLEAVTHGVAGHPHVTRALAAASGHALVRLPDAPPADVDVFGWLANLAKEAGEVQAELGRALADDRHVSAGEARLVRVQVAELLSLLVGMDAGLAEIERAG